jgi:dihydrofolate reductase
MRKLIVTEFMSLDGVIESPMWTLPYWNDEIAAFKAEETSNNQPILLGRVTYDGFAQAWPERTDVESGGVYFNGTRKYVVSTTLHTADWNNSVIIRDNVVEQIRKLKQEDGADIVVHGSANLVQTLMQHDVVDQYRFLIYPVVLGKGQRLFQDNALKLRLVESRAFSSGVVAVVYEPDRSK